MGRQSVELLRGRLNTNYEVYRPTSRVISERLLWNVFFFLHVGYILFTTQVGVGQGLILSGYGSVTVSRLLKTNW